MSASRFASEAAAPSAPAVAAPRSTSSTSSAPSASSARSLPPVASGGSREERVQACAARLAGRAEAVDVLVASLSRVLTHPQEEKYRRVNPRNPAFARTVGAVPGGVEMLMAVGYEPLHGQLVLQTHDAALLWLGKEALQRAKASEAYLGDKEGALVERALAASAAEYGAELAARRAACAARVPPEPAEGAAGSAALCVHTPAGAAVWRRFEAGSTLEDVANFARSLDGVPLDGRLRLTNVTIAPHVRLDLDTQIGLDLQALDMWPTGHVRAEHADAPTSTPP